MTELILTRTRLEAGIWHGVLTGATKPPRLSVTHLNRELPGLNVIEAKEEGMWLVEVPIPSEIIADGVQTLVISDEESGATLDKITLIAGDALDHDLRAEVDLLRAELDMLKRAFRHHCVETA
jgi:hypothetical protein